MLGLEDMNAADDRLATVGALRELLTTRCAAYEVAAVEEDAVDLVGATNGAHLVIGNFLGRLLLGAPQRLDLLQ